MPQRQVLEDEIAAGADRSEECCDGPGVAAGLSLRHDHGSQYLSDHFQGELRFLGIRSSPSFVAAPGGNGCAERFIRTLKEQLLWVEPFETVQQPRLALLAFKDRYNQKWLVERHGPPHPGRRPPGALAEHRSGCMIAASEVSKKPGAVQSEDRAVRGASVSAWRGEEQRRA